MLVLPTTAAELQPGSRVVVFPKDYASGETIGYFGTVIGTRRIFHALSPENPAAWVYWVRGPGPVAWQIVAARQMLVEASEDESFAASPIGPAWQVRFDEESDQMCQRIGGRYRLAKRSWARFEFVKGTDDIPHYELRLPANALACETPALLWQVPAWATLDRAYVLRALTELFGPGP